jgi:2-polyprenyl-3-methyl-5-hydroxy-6-metoxy-1,4-benzoquinol methylase
MAILDLSTLPLDRTELQALRELLGDVQKVELDLPELWRLMDDVWDAMGCDGEMPDWDLIASYYRHPVWLLNGLFVEADPLSMQHRRAIAGWIAGEAITRVLDFGGGFGTLASLIADTSEHVWVDILEPHPPRIGLERASQRARVGFVSSLHAEREPYDCLVSTDVLEHVADPLKLLREMRDVVRPDGYLLLANNFHPVIKCHLPRHFHLRATFELFALALGLARIGRVPDTHAVIYRKLRSPVQVPDATLRRLERLSRVGFPVLDRARRWGGQAVRRARAALP